LGVEDSAIYGFAFPPRMDPDYVDLPSFGEGLNAGATVGVNVPLATTTMLTLSAGYVGRGKFDREDFVAPPAAQTAIRIDPGNVATVNAALGYSDGPWTAQGSLLGRPASS
ncbi:MAG: hypothetical protein JWL62_11, partial [Hyphomicrobiales bacterium]|nr:hypothetical protein [Hyphomicrobiales bacterium]